MKQSLRSSTGPTTEIGSQIPTETVNEFPKVDESYVTLSEGWLDTADWKVATLHEVLQMCRMHRDEVV